MTSVLLLLSACTASALWEPDGGSTKASHGHACEARLREDVAAATAMERGIVESITGLASLARRILTLNLQGRARGPGRITDERTSSAAHLVHVRSYLFLTYFSLLLPSSFFLLPSFFLFKNSAPGANHPTTSHLIQPFGSFVGAWHAEWHPVACANCCVITLRRTVQFIRRCVVC